MAKIKEQGKVVKSTEDIKEFKSKIPASASYDVDELMRRQKALIDQAVASRNIYNSKLSRVYRKRFGLRPPASWPFYGASNLHLPLQDTMIRKMKPEYLNVTFQSTPMCELIPRDMNQDQGAAEEASWAFDYLMRNEMDIYPEIILTADKMLEKGFTYLRCIECIEFEPKTIVLDIEEEEQILKKRLINKDDGDVFTNPAKYQLLMQVLIDKYAFDTDDQADIDKLNEICAKIYSGEKIVEFNITVKSYDNPKIIATDPEDVVVPKNTHSVFNLEKAEWIAYKYSCSIAEMKKNGLIGKWDKEVTENCLEKRGIHSDGLADDKYLAGHGTPVKQGKAYAQKNQREGVEVSDTEISDFVIWEVSLWFDADNDGIEERHILEYSDDYPSKPLRFIKYPYQMNMWQWVKVPFEVIDTRHYSPRGIVEILDPLASALNVQHNMKINRQIIASTPTLLYVPGTVNPQNFKYIPGQAIPVKGEGGINANVQWFTAPDTSQSFSYEEQNLRGWAETLAAANDYSSSQGQQKKTATQTNYDATSRTGIRVMDIQVWQQALKEVYKRIWAIWLENDRDANFTYIVNGVVKTIGKNALQKAYDFSPSGTYANSNPSYVTQVAVRSFEEFRGDGRIHQTELYRDYITSTRGPRVADRLLLSDDELQQAQQAAAQGQINAKSGNTNPHRDLRGMQQVGARKQQGQPI